MTALASPDANVARAALDYLFDNSRSFLDRYLLQSCNLKDPQVRADIAQTSFLRLWSSRATFQNLGESAWRGWLQRTASRCYVDYLRSARRLASEDEFDLHSIPSEERPIIDAVLMAVESDELFRVADVVFLDLDADVSPRMHERRLLAAQLFYIDGEAWSTVLRLLGPAVPGEPALTRDELDRWLADYGVLRHLTFRELFYDNDRLTAHLLGWPEMPNEDRARALDKLLQDGLAAQAGAMCGATTKAFSWEAVLVMVWRFRHALLTDQIRARTDHGLAHDEIETILQMCVAEFPFAKKMRTTVSRIVPDGDSHTRGALFSGPGLWQRLALEYRYREDLPHRDINDRIKPAADVVGYDLTAGMLNVWLSNGRLVKRLAQKVREIHGDLEGKGTLV